MFFFDTNNKEKEFRPRSVEHAYLAILNEDLETAQAVFESVDSPRACWGKAFVDIISGYIEKYPTYFEIRNFLEIDLDFLIKNEKIAYVEQFLGSLELLSKINQEVYKYVARVMLENKLYNVALEYMEKSKKIFYNDPELHFMLAKYYISKNELDESKHYLDECLKIIPDYFPALRLKEFIQNDFV